MESLLASIRKAIDSDIGKNTKSAIACGAGHPPSAAPCVNLRVRYDDEPPAAPRCLRGNFRPAQQDPEKPPERRLYRAPAALAKLPALPPPPPRGPHSKSGFAGILGGDGQQVTPWAPRVKHEAEAPDLRPTIQDDLPPPAGLSSSGYGEAEVYPEEVGWAEDEPAFAPPAPLMSPETINAANSSFNQLGRHPDGAGPGRTLHRGHDPGPAQGHAAELA